MELPDIYKGDYRKLVVVPLVLILIALYFIAQVQPGLELKGGVLVTLELEKPLSSAELTSYLQNAGFDDFSVRTYKLGESAIAEIEIGHDVEVVELENSYRNFLDTYDKYSKKQYEILVLKGSNGSTKVQEQEALNLEQRIKELRGKLIKSSSILLGKKAELTDDTEKLKPEVEKLFADVTLAYRETIVSKISKQIPYKSYSFKLVNPSLSEVFVGKIEGVLLAAAVLSALAVFAIFRDFTPSIAVLVGATSDIIFALGAMGLLGIPLSLAAIASILMLVGFSLDTDILLTVRILKRGLKDPRGSAYEAMKTGVTMSFSAILAFVALFIVGQLTNIAVYQSISQIVLAGLIGDLIATWLLNAVIMIHHVEGVKREGFVVR